MISKPQNGAPQAPQRSFDVEDIEMIREVVLIGLASYGELQKVLNAKEVRRSIGADWPKDIEVIDPAEVTAVAKFADVLRLIEHAR